MTYEVNNEEFRVIINKKVTTKNTYIRVNDDLDIVVSTNIWTSDKYLNKLLKDNYKSIERMINIKKKKMVDNSKFYYLGKSYDVVLTNKKGIIFGNDKVFIGKDTNIDKELKKLSQELFLDRLNYYYNSFSYDIPYPSLTIRKMKSRWGVCNVRSKRITLNLELIKKNPACLDYVIVHELSHLIEANHSKEFWRVVEENYKDYKKVRKMLKE